MERDCLMILQMLRGSIPTLLNVMYRIDQADLAAFVTIRLKCSRDFEHEQELRGVELTQPSYILRSL